MEKKLIAAPFLKNYNNDLVFSSPFNIPFRKNMKILYNILKKDFELRRD